MIKVGRKQYNTNIENVLIDLREYISNKDQRNILKDINDSGSNVMITCPYHKNGEERKPSCGISKQDNNNTPMGTVHCFTCGKTTSLEKLISNLLGYEDSGEEGRKYLEQNYDLSYNRKIDLNFERNDQLIDDWIPKFEEHTNYSDYLPLFKFKHEYMYKRGLTDEIIEKYDIGLDRFIGAITFPVKDKNGKLIFIAKRWINQKRFLLPEDLNKPLYGLFELDYNKKSLYVVESFFNALTLVKWGYNAIALMGTGTNDQIKELDKLPFRSIYLCLDGDLAGRSGNIRIASQLSKNKNIYILEMYEGKDVNDLTLEEFLKITEKKFN